MKLAANTKQADVRARPRIGPRFLLAVALTSGFACSSADDPNLSGNGGSTASGGNAAAGSTGMAPATGAGSGQGGSTLGPGGAGSSGSGGSPSHAGSAGVGAGTAGSAGTGGIDGGSAGSAGASGNGGSAGGGSAFDPCPATGACKVLPLGDSITFGTPTNNGGYRVELFSKAVADSKHMTFVGSQMNGPAMVANEPFPKSNEGYPGWTIAQIDGIATSMNALKDAPHIVLLHIGTNDMYQGANGAPMRLGKLIDDIVAVLPNSLLAVSSIIPFPGATGAVDTYNEAVPGLVQQRANAGKHVIYVDQFKDFPTSELGDGVHPNDADGYPRMGRVWYAAIKPYLH